jgi:hypothetical protein
MGNRSYGIEGVVLKAGQTAGYEIQVRELQKDLRELGYLKQGIDGQFGTGTELAVKALQHDLMHNDGRSSQNDGDAPVKVVDFNRGRVVLVTGSVDSKLAGCISDMLDNPDFPLLPKADNPEEENDRIVALMHEMSSKDVPIPFLMAMLKQESDLRHYNVPGKGDDDTYIVTGLDRNASEKHIITSRGYGAGQYTLFHHPPTKQEVDDFMLDVSRNLNKASRELSYKFHNFVNGNTSGTRADDRVAEHGKGPLMRCKYDESDPRHMKDCKQCAIDAGQHDIKAGVTPLFDGSQLVFTATEYYSTADYHSVPIRGKLACDWAYAARRYNGSGINSYHYQAIILRNLITL